LLELTTTIVPGQPKQNIIQAVREYGKRLFYFIRGRVDSDEDAEDILQDVWYSFTDVMSQEPIQQTSAWLYRVARNKIIDRYRKQQNNLLEDEFDANSIADILSEIPKPGSAQLKEVFWENLFAALEELPEEQRQVFIWNEIEEHSFREIADRTGENINTLISRKRYAVIHLRTRLEQFYKLIIEH